MNREVMKSMGTKRIPIDRLTSLLQTFALKHAAKALPDLLETADLENATNKQFCCHCWKLRLLAGMNAAGKGIIQQHTSRLIYAQ